MIGFAADGRPRVLLAVGDPTAAFGIVAEQVRARLGADLDVAIARTEECVAGECDLLVAFWWGDVPWLRANVRARRCIVRIADDFAWRHDEGPKRLWWALARADLAVIANRRLAHAVAETSAWEKTQTPIQVIEDGVDCERFRPRRWPWRFRAGWAGNSFPAASGAGLVDLKGVRLIREVCERTGTRLDMADVQSRSMIVHEDMPLWYRRLSVYVCASLAEGTPLPVLEAMACGRPVISTAVGLVPELVRDGVNGWSIERSADGLAAGLARARRADLKVMGRAARETALAYDWSVIAQKWRGALHDVLQDRPRCALSAKAD